MQEVIMGRKNVIADEFLLLLIDPEAGEKSMMEATAIVKIS